MSLITSSSVSGMLDSKEWLQSCDTIRLYKSNAERGKKDTELLTISIWDNESEFRDLIQAIEAIIQDGLEVAEEKEEKEETDALRHSR